MKKTYYEHESQLFLDKLKLIQSELPPYCKDYFHYLKQSNGFRTIVSYANDLKIFFYFLSISNSIYTDPKKIPLELLNSLKPSDINEFMMFLEHYTYNGTPYKNSSAGRNRKLSSLRSFYNYLCYLGFVENNPPSMVRTPKLSKKNVLVLSDEEKNNLLHVIQYGTNLSKKQLETHRITRIRDEAIFTLFLGTGMRVSELVGIDLEHINFNKHTIELVRKGGNEDYIFFGQEIEAILQRYIEHSRLQDYKPELHENALFLSLKGTRLHVNSVENLAKKYAVAANISPDFVPHTCRKTYGTQLYNATSDIRLVADVLGHSSILTTSTHYVLNSDSNKASIANQKIFKENLTDENIK